ncbi:MAG: ComF family protein [Clostridia bacterium]|nr:ComF family protein [Clostridia bacterium]
MKLTKRLAGIVFPPRCVVCRSPLPRDGMICPGCERYVNHPDPSRSRCAVCFLPQKECVCGKKLYYEKLAAPFIGSTPAKQSVYDMKFRQKLDLVKPLAHFMKLALDERDMTDGIDLITYIPMDRGRRFRKGFDHAEELAKELAKLTGRPCAALLERRQKVPPQHSLKKRILRSGNLLGVFEPVGKRLPDIAGKRILLVDDIATTGATFNEAAKTLMIFGAETVYCACALLNPKPKQKKNRRRGR